MISNDAPQSDHRRHIIFNQALSGTVCKALTNKDTKQEQIDT